MNYYAYVASDPYCQKDCGFDLGCMGYKAQIGCGGGIGPENAWYNPLNHYQPGVVTPSGHGGETKNPNGCDSGDPLCNAGNSLQNAFGLGGTCGPIPLGCLPLAAVGIVGLIVLVMVLKK